MVGRDLENAAVHPRGNGKPAALVMLHGGCERFLNGYHAGSIVPALVPAPWACSRRNGIAGVGEFSKPILVAVMNERQSAL
ncbi:protein of unknown function (plasmid) [Azospirillum lipoferum 4B]|uniref:Uncharacterized protein n=1 Tax=Azospirillum lipoferum (strain 4B) TaxID=862719 RepID=G7ZIV2_AZOL4|nr:protein of unknown function [Azospirillum lipoferum 4B]